MNAVLQHSKWRASMLFGIAALACGVDERALELSPTAGANGTGASPSAGVGSGTPLGGDEASQPEGGASGTGSEANAGGEPTMPPVLPPLLDGCADLDTDGISDCSVTLVENATFKSDVSGWKGVDVGSLAWSSKNALADTPSGCALLTAQGSMDIDGSALIRASQCVPVAGGQLAIAYANALVEGSAAAEHLARAKLDVSYFEDADCAGKATGYFSTPPNAATGAWVTIQAGGVTDSNTKAALVELVGVKPYRAESLSVCFDNVMLKTKPQ